MKVLAILCTFALAKGGIIGPAASDSTVYSYLNAPVVTKTVTPIAYTTPAPVYETVLSTHESRSQSQDGTQYNTFAKSLQTPYASLQKFDSRSTNGGILDHSPIYSTPTIHSGPVLSQPDAYISTPLVNTVSSPITYHALPAPVISKTISSPAIASYSHPIITKTVTPGLSTYGVNTPVIQSQPAVKVVYSEAPSVSHMTFTGLGTSYSW